MAATAAGTMAAVAAASLGTPCPASADAPAVPRPILLWPGTGGGGTGGGGDSEGGGEGAGLLQRLLSDGDVYHPGPPAPWAARQAYYPKWMFGEWDVKSRPSGTRAPLGPKFARGAPLAVAAAAGATADGGGDSRDGDSGGGAAAFMQRFYSTLPDTFSNRARVNLGLLPEDAVIPDRAFNAAASAGAYLGDPSAVQDASYDPRDSPDRLTISFSKVSADMRPLPPKRLEIFFQNIRTGDVDPVYSEDAAPSDASWPPANAPCFVVSELCRQVLLGVRQADVQDYEVVTAYALLGPGRVVARQRTLLYLEPRDELYFSARGRAVAVYDRELRYDRVPAPDGAYACVETPKDVVQCI